MKPAVDSPLDPPTRCRRRQRRWRQVHFATFADDDPWRTYRRGNGARCCRKASPPAASKSALGGISGTGDSAGQRAAFCFVWTSSEGGSPLRTMHPRAPTGRDRRTGTVATATASDPNPGARCSEVPAQGEIPGQSGRAVLGGERTGLRRVVVTQSQEGAGGHRRIVAGRVVDARSQGGAQVVQVPE